MNKIYQVGHLRIDLRKFYQYWIDKEDQFDKVGWSSSWYCGDDLCDCGELEHLEECKPNLKIRLVPWYKRIFTLYNKDRYIYTIIGFIIGLIL